MQEAKTPLDQRGLQDPWLDNCQTCFVLYILRSVGAIGLVGASQGVGRPAIVSPTPTAPHRTVPHCLHCTEARRAGFPDKGLRGTR
eukprot:1507370-Pyramimonas_sp.AAC.2